MSEELTPEGALECAERELVRAALTGSSEAFGELVRRYQRPFFNAAYRIVGSRDEAQDAVQNALVRIFRNLDQIDLARPFSSWAYRITINEALRVIERRPAERPEGLPGTDSASLEVVSPGDPHKELCAHEVEKQLREALQTLSDDHRTVLVLRHFHDLAYVEIAEIVGIAEKTVKSRLFEARRALRMEMLRRGNLG